MSKDMLFLFKKKFIKDLELEYLRRNTYMLYLNQ